MNNSLHKRIEMAANVAILAVALLLCFVLVKTFLLNGASRDQVSFDSIKPGTKVSLPDVDWSQSERHLVFVLQTGCHFCTESAPFYRRLTQAVGKRNDVELIAVLPQSISESKQYLNSLGVAINEVRQADLSSVGATGTPTLALVDKTGAVTDVWIGRLPAVKEQEVFSRLQ